MKNLVAALCTSALIATAFVGSTSEAQANDVGLGIAAGIIGGVAVGSIIASQPRERVYVEERPAPIYEEDVTVCKKVLYEDDYGHRYWKRVCHQR
ncbi:MAG: hypothetical protein P4L98_14100 [Ancalomicrobiaceae bacterium]|nr:hypothetical protein [Ancalomicrobiaceae bacterium]